LVKETATYMLGRVYLNQAQEDFKLYSEHSKPDSQLLVKAKNQFKAYLAAYPNGLYTGSARSLFRKIDWLGNDYSALTADYSDQLASFRQHAPGTDEILRFIDEVESKYPLSTDEDTVWASPLIASVGTLMALRQNTDYSAHEKPVKTYLQATLQSHKEQFSQAGLGALYDYLMLAYRFYVDKDFAQVIQLTETTSSQAAPSNVAFSSLVLRGLAFGAQGQWDKAEALWSSLLTRLQNPGQKAQAQWLLALTWQQQERLDKLYQADLPIDKPSIHDFFIASASPALLEVALGNQKLQPSTRTRAFNTLMEKQLTHRQYAEFLRIAKQYPATQFESSEDLHMQDFDAKPENEGYPCPHLQAIVGGLLKNPKSAPLLNCYGDALAQRLGGPSTQWPDVDDNGLTSYNLAFYYPNGQEGLKAGTETDKFGGKQYTSLDLYIEAINLPNAQGEAKAYALHKALNCFIHTGMNRCGTQDIPLERRAEWFHRLKTDHKNSPWAQAQKYYW
jgi:hypothetical protein